MKRLILVGFMIFNFSASFSQCDVIKTNLSTYIKTGLLAPTTFKIHRYSCEQISPSIPKLQSDLKKRKTSLNNQYYLLTLHRDSLRILYAKLSNICDSLRLKINSSHSHMEKIRLEKKIKELKVNNIPKDHEFILWQAARGIDTTKSSLAFAYSNELKKIPVDTNENVYKKYNSLFNRASYNLDTDNNELLLLSTKIELTELYLYKTQELPIYKAYIVYQAMNKGGQNALSEEEYYFNKNYKCIGKDYTEFWNSISLIE